MKITITRKDWEKGIEYQRPCGCLLARAIRRKLRRTALVWPGEVEVGGLDYSYDLKIEARLKRAHKDPALLPITIELE